MGGEWEDWVLEVPFTVRMPDGGMPYIVSFGSGLNVSLVPPHQGVIPVRFSEGMSQIVILPAILPHGDYGPSEIVSVLGYPLFVVPSAPSTRRGGEFPWWGWEYELKDIRVSFVNSYVTTINGYLIPAILNGRAEISYLDNDGFSRSTGFVSKLLERNPCENSTNPFLAHYNSNEVIPSIHYINDPDMTSPVIIKNAKVVTYFIDCLDFLTGGQNF